MKDPGSIVTLQHPDGKPWALLARRRGNGWARVYIERDGNVVASSDWGTYSHWWSCPGGDESEPLMTRVARHLARPPGRDYLIGKFNAGRPKVFDGDKTMKAIRELILQRHKSGSLDREQARNEWELIEDAESEDAWELAEYSYNSDVQHFVDNVILGWLVPLLRKWLDEEDRKAWPRLCVQAESFHVVLGHCEEPEPDARAFRCRRVPASKAIDAEQLTKLIAESVGEDVQRWVEVNMFANWDNVGARPRPSAPDALRRWADASLVVDAWEVGPEATADDVARHILYDQRLADALAGVTVDVESGEVPT